MVQKSDKRILVHTCCAPCAAPSVEKILLDGRAVTLFYCNSNIHPEAEYLKRLESVRKLAGIMNLIVEEDEYDHAKWLAWISGLESEPEKGRRCAKCFEYSLARTAEVAARHGFPNFTTTLTLSPHKVSKVIFGIGAKFPRYLPYDFKKEDGFIRSVKLSDEYGLYRQDYCGCEFSRALSR